MGDAAQSPWIDYDAYLALERATDQRHEWLDGVVYALPVGSLAHAALAIAMGAELRTLALPRGCRVFSSDAKLRIPATGLSTYPDLSVVSGPIVVDPVDANAMINPVVLVEVLSDGTESFDRGEKFAHYRRIPTLRDYVMVSQHKALIEVYSRDGHDLWTLREAGAGQSVALVALPGVVEIDRVYDGVELTPAPLRGLRRPTT